ncbi:substrate-binding domain-containing protein [Mucilaginibacter sp. cycad4]|uniref:substrate-binding domain-containing protein n=1 Tax=Mucilaginibacter sp. cycad4 TaxID=3342096 RepID=UPI002AAB7798|nr:substrate-binding domain-containing protein [Mucilaginibacter gossypii]WPV01992.1 substrate-binding domain-containing protein [Mucilaginibacter gossypii]
MKNKIVRIKDIAEKAKVSTGTVDRVLHKRGRVSKKVEEKVLKIIEEMDYEPNLMARALGSNRIYQIAALIPDHEIDSYWHAPKAGIEKAEKDLKQYGIIVQQYVFDPYDVDSFISKANKLTNDKPDGIILSPIFYRETLPFFEKWKAAEIPFVLFNTQIAECEPLSYIGQDSYQSGFLAGKLIHYGQPDSCSVLIAHIDEETSNAAHLLKKEQGFRNYFSQNNLEHQYKILRVELNRSNAAVFMKQLSDVIDSTPDLASIFVTTSKAHEIAKYLEQRYIKHIKIIGYDLLAPNLYFLNKGTISFLINQNPKGQGYWGIYQLTDSLVFKKEVPVIKYLPLDIVTKENVNYYADDDDAVFLDI